MCKVNVTHIIKLNNWRANADYGLNTPLEGVFLTLPYQIDSLPDHVRLNKHCKNKLESKCC